MKLLDEALNEIGGFNTHGLQAFSPLEQEPKVRKLAELSTVVVKKHSSGFRPEDIERFADSLEGALDEQPKFIIFDFAHRSGLSNAPRASAGFPELIHACANLIINSSTIAIAWARGPMAGADLEFALSCSMMAAEAPATFLFSPHGTAYTFLARKIGLSRAENVMLESQELSAFDMRNLLLIRHREESADGSDAGLESYARLNLRRHNALAHLYRAQRLVMPVPFEMVKAAQAS